MKEHAFLRKGEIKLDDIYNYGISSTVCSIQARWLEGLSAGFNMAGLKTEAKEIADIATYLFRTMRLVEDIMKANEADEDDYTEKGRVNVRQHNHGHGVDSFKPSTGAA